MRSVRQMSSRSLRVREGSLPVVAECLDAWSSVPSCCWPRSSVSVEGRTARAFWLQQCRLLDGFPGHRRDVAGGAGDLSEPVSAPAGQRCGRDAACIDGDPVGVRGAAVFSMLFRLDIARGYLAIALPLGAVALIGMRTVARRYVARSRRDGRFVHAVLAVGNPHSIRCLAASFARRPADGLKLVGACGPGLEGRTSLESRRRRASRSCRTASTSNKRSYSRALTLWCLPPRT